MKNNNRKHVQHNLVAVYFYSYLLYGVLFDDFVESVFDMLVCVGCLVYEG